MKISDIKSLIENNEIDNAITLLQQQLDKEISDIEKADVYYVLGNAYRKKTDWKNALDSYQKSTELNPESPAVEARKMTMDILEFFHKDMYNQ